MCHCYFYQQTDKDTKIKVASFVVYSVGCSRSVDVIMTSSKMPFLLYPRRKKADNIPYNNFDKFKHTLTIFGRQH